VCRQTHRPDRRRGLRRPWEASGRGRTSAAEEGSSVSTDPCRSVVDETATRGPALAHSFRARQAARAVARGDQTCIAAVLRAAEVPNRSQFHVLRPGEGTLPPWRAPFLLSQARSADVLANGLFSRGWVGRSDNVKGLLFTGICGYIEVRPYVCSVSRCSEIRKCCPR
jgi:hypothetical protein